MANHPSESQKDGLDNLAAIIRAAPSDIQLSDFEEAQLGTVFAALAPDLDAPMITPQKTQEEHRAKWLADQQGPKAKTVRRSKPSPAQIEIARYRREEGREAWNEYQKAKRWVKADKEGREITARQNLKAMTPEQKAEHKREQAAARKRRERAKII